MGMAMGVYFIFTPVMQHKQATAPAPSTRTPLRSPPTPDPLYTPPPPSLQSDIPFVNDHVSKLVHIGKATVDKLLDLKRVSCAAAARRWCAWVLHARTYPSAGARVRTLA